VIVLFGLAPACGAGAPRAALEIVGPADVHEARVHATRGPAFPEEGDECTIEVHRTTDAYYNCRIRVECRGDIVYGLADGGYNTCHSRGARFVFARDRNGTRADGDPRLYFDLVGGRVFIADDVPDIEIDIQITSESTREFDEIPLDLLP
jgi:hypothetical protein